MNRYDITVTLDDSSEAGISGRATPNAVGKWCLYEDHVQRVEEVRREERQFWTTQVKEMEETFKNSLFQSRWESIIISAFMMISWTIALVWIQ